MRSLSFMKWKLWAGVAGASTLLVGGSSARGALTLYVTINGGPTLTVPDDSFNDADPVSGQIIYNDTTSPNFTGSVHVTTSNSPGDPMTGGLLQIDSTLVGTGGGTISLTAVDTGFMFPAPGNDLLGTTATFSGPPTDAGAFYGYANSATTGLKVLHGPSGDNYSSAPFNYAGTYSLKAVISSDVPQGDVVVLGETVTVTPEPGSLALAGIAATALLGRRRRQMA